MSSGLGKAGKGHTLEAIFIPVIATDATVFGATLLNKLDAGISFVQCHTQCGQVTVFFKINVTVSLIAVPCNLVGNAEVD